MPLLGAIIGVNSIGYAVSAEKYPIQHSVKKEESQNILPKLQSYGLVFPMPQNSEILNESLKTFETIASLFVDLPNIVTTGNGAKLTGDNAKLYIVGKLLLDNNNARFYEQYEESRNSYEEIINNFLVNIDRFYFNQSMPQLIYSSSWNKEGITKNLNTLKENLNNDNIKIKIRTDNTLGTNDDNLTRSKLISYLYDMPYYLIVPDDYKKYAFERFKISESGPTDGQKFYINQSYNINTYPPEFFYYKSQLNANENKNANSNASNDGINITKTNMTKELTVNIPASKSFSKDLENKNNIVFFTFPVDNNIENHLKDNSILFFLTPEFELNLKTNNSILYPVNSLRIKNELGAKNNLIVIPKTLENSRFFVENEDNQPLYIVIDDEEPLQFLIDLNLNVSYKYKNNFIGVNGNVLIKSPNGIIDTSINMKRLSILRLVPENYFILLDKIIKSSKTSIELNDTFVDVYLQHTYNKYPMRIVNNMIQITYDQVNDLVEMLYKYQNESNDKVDIYQIMNHLKIKMDETEFNKAYMNAEKLFNIKTEDK